MATVRAASAWKDPAVAAVTTVDDPSDPRLADYVALNDAALRRRIETPALGHGIFIAEGTTVIRRLLRSPYAVRSVLVTPAKLVALRPDLERFDVDVLVGSPELLHRVAGFDLHRGAVAAADRRAPTPLAQVLAGQGPVAVLEGLNDHENLGAIARSAAALGVGGLVLDPTCADLLYRRCVRVSMGEVLLLPFTRAERWPGGLDEIRASGFRVLALTPAADAASIDDVTVGPSDRIALLLGAEGPGLSAAALEAADELVRIPLAPGIDSLNVGHAAAVAFHCIGRLTPA